MSVVFYCKWGGCDIINKRGCYYEEENVFIYLSAMPTNEFWLHKNK